MHRRASFAVRESSAGERVGNCREKKGGTRDSSRGRRCGGERAVQDAFSRLSPVASTHFSSGATDWSMHMLVFSSLHFILFFSCLLATTQFFFSFRNFTFLRECSPWTRQRETHQNSKKLGVVGYWSSGGGVFDSLSLPSHQNTHTQIVSSSVRVHRVGTPTVLPLRQDEQQQHLQQ